MSDEDQTLSALATACDVAYGAHLAAKAQAATAEQTAADAHAALKSAVAALVTAAQAKDA